MNKELIFWRTLALSAVAVVFFFFGSAFRKSGNQRFSEIDVERINIIEKDGTVKMVITNVERFPAGKDSLNGRPTNDTRKKRAGMLFFNEEGMECGGLIYDGQKRADGHSSGLSLTYDQYDGDQVVQLMMQDFQQGDSRVVTGGLRFNDQAPQFTHQRVAEISDELEDLRRKDPKAAQEKLREYRKQGYGGIPRMMLGKTGSETNGLFLFDDAGKMRATFYVDKDNQAGLNFFDDKGQVIASFPDKAGNK